MDASLARDVRERAGHVCEYCRMPESNYPTVPFPIDHIIARQHGGSTTLDNLALSRLHDNTHKGPNIAGGKRWGHSELPHQAGEQRQDPVLRDRPLLVVPGRGLPRRPREG